MSHFVYTLISNCFRIAYQKVLVCILYFKASHVTFFDLTMARVCFLSTTITLQVYCIQISIYKRFALLKICLFTKFTKVKYFSCLCIYFNVSLKDYIIAQLKIGCTKIVNNDSFLNSSTKARTKVMFSNVILLMVVIKAK